MTILEIDNKQEGLFKGKSPLKIKKRALKGVKIQKFKNNGFGETKENFQKEKIKLPLKKPNSSLRNWNNPKNIEIDSETTFGRNRGSLQEVIVNLESKFLEKVTTNTNKKYNFVNNSLGNRHIFPQKINNHENSNINLVTKQVQRMFKNLANEKFTTFNMPEEKRILNNDTNILQHQF